MKDKLIYRIRSNNSNSYSDKYKYVNSAKDIKDDLISFLNSNYLYSVSKKTGFTKEVLDKNMVILKSFDNIFEMEKEVYECYKKEIDNAISKNVISLINEYEKDVYSGLVKIKLSPTTKAIKPVLKTNDGLYKTKKIIGIDTIYLNYTDINDIKLLKKMILEVIDDNFYGPYFDKNYLILSNKNKKIKLDKNVYYLFERVKLDQIRENKDKSKQLRMVR